MAPTRPRLAPWYRLVEDGDRLLLEHGRTVVVLAGGAVRTLLPALLPLLDGSRTVDEIAAVLGKAAEPAVRQALDLLAANDLLVDGLAPSAAGSAAQAVAAAYRVEPAIVAERLRSASVGIVGRATTADRLARLLRADGVGEVRRLGWEDGEVDLVVVSPQQNEMAMLSEWNRHALERGLRWLALRPFDGLIVGVGPLVIPGETCCHECVLLRLASQVDYGADLARIEAAPVAAAGSSGLESIAAGLAAHLALSWLGGFDTRLPGVLHVLETRPGLELREHRVLRVPRCPACSPAARLAPTLPWHEARAA